MNRHDMLWLNDEGIRYARKSVEAADQYVSEEEWNTLIVPEVPAIVSRQELRADGVWQVGFSSHLKKEGNRLRIASVIPEGSIEKIVTPYDISKRICSSQTVQTPVIRRLVGLGEVYGFQLGVYGSLALQTLTSRPYFSEKSDYDIYIAPKGIEADARGFEAAIRKLEREQKIKIDCEMDCAGYGVKLRELVSDSQTVLGKGLFDVQLLNPSVYRKIPSKQG